jgi:hypothetical protein
VPATDTFAARLALIRQRMGWNLKEAALACALPASSWRGWELSGSRPHNYVEVCRVISTTTGCNYRWLVDGESPNPHDGLPRLDSNQKPTVYSPAERVLPLAA